MIRTSAFAIGLLLAAPILSAGTPLAEPSITVYKTPTCGCCTKWIDHLERNGFDVKPVDMTDLRLVKSMSGIAPEQASCHTARIGDYVVEGHVPAGDIRRLLAEQSSARGLAVPGMPLGSPGMEAPNPQPYQVLLIEEDGNTSVFAEHQGPTNAGQRTP